MWRGAVRVGQGVKGHGKLWGQDHTLGNQEGLPGGVLGFQGASDALSCSIFIIISTLLGAKRYKMGPAATDR